MPWYRVPFDLNQRARHAAESVKGTKFNEAMLELVKCAAEDQAPLLAGTYIHMNFGSRGNKTAPRPCSVCGWVSERECDWVVNHSILIHGKPKTCDAPLCRCCTFSPAPEKDICPKHVGPLKAWLAGRSNSVDGEGP